MESSSGSKGNATSSRWNPTPEQLRILKELYHVRGVRSPTAEQIHHISWRLSRYGRIEGKNVFYWFQNHKARERQKERLNTLRCPTPQPQGRGGISSVGHANNKEGEEEKDRRTLQLFPLARQQQEEDMSSVWREQPQQQEPIDVGLHLCLGQFR